MVAIWREKQKTWRLETSQCWDIDQLEKDLGLTLDDPDRKVKDKGENELKCLLYLNLNGKSNTMARKKMGWSQTTFNPKASPLYKSFQDLQDLDKHKKHRGTPIEQKPKWSNLWIICKELEYSKPPGKFSPKLQKLFHRRKFIINFSNDCSDEDKQLIYKEFQELFDGK